MVIYQFDHQWKTERRRLAALEEIGDPVTIGYLEKIGVQTGWTCLEVGAGGGSIAEWLCNKAGPDGHVVATDLETKFLEAIDKPNLIIRKHDIIHDDLEKDHFDLIHARAVLEHLPERDSAILKMIDALKPGGWLMIGDADYISFMAQTDQHADLFDRGQKAFFKILTSAGWDLNYGRKIAPMLRKYRLADVQVGMSATEWGNEHPATDIWKYAFERARDPVVDAGFLTIDEADAFLDLLTLPDFFAVSPLFFYAWGRKP